MAWIDANRNEVNPISGQLGVQGGAGVSTALTQRVAIATDANAITGSVISYGVGSIYGIGIGSIYAYIAGSVEIKTNLALIGSYSIQNIAGSAYVTGSINIATPINQLGAYDQMNAIFVSGVYSAVNYATFNNYTSGTALSVVAATAGSKITVLAYNAIAKTAVDFVFRDAATEKSGWKYLAANTGIVASYNPKGWFQTAAGGSVCIVANSTGSVGGELTYIKST